MRRGFSLLEVVIMVVIIGIPATLAYPSLEGYLQRSKQTEAKVGLSAVYTAQKIYFAVNQTYADSLSNLDVQLETGGAPAIPSLSPAAVPPSLQLPKAT